ncbi:MAG: NAD(P)-binding domain-containing protein, partial [Lactococcus lactis]|nr:NAD(P)-binding domain-containing protein [Lactococcus lactis]MDN5993561.1 NAD(P)-binding domain-containing protein [Lactococcus lactis]MDN6034314.1 NAD(P)-binding domain-containing protein [Lactococcus lactis]
MKFGMIGLGKMGMNLVKNAVDHEIEVVAYDLNTKAVEEAKDYSDNITAVSTIENLLTELPASKIVWLMLPAGTPTNSTIEMLSEKLSAGDILIDGGNSNYKDNLEQNKLLTEKGIKFFDVGTSGGMAG